jgi:glutamyl-tRNA synthetase
MKKIRTRFAPSPTGFIHLGNLRSALYTYLIAKSKGGDFILRIEDTDQKRLVEGAIDAIYNTLSDCGLNWDEGPDKGGDFGPYIQSERVGNYKGYALDLVEKGEAYPCFCSEERISKLREEANEKKETFFYDRHCYGIDKEEAKQRMETEEFVIRQKTPDDGETTFNCEVYGEISIQNELIEDQVLLKSDSYPTYNFANVVDDHLMNITHVVRGNEYLTSTPKYTLLYRAFGWEQPTYVHLPQVVKEGGKKLSKRDGDAYYGDFTAKGYLPEAIINHLALLGWSPEGKKEIFDLDKLEQIFSIKRISSSPSAFDIKKLDWINNNYIKKADENRIYDLALPYLTEAYDLSGYGEDNLRKLVKIYQSRLNNVSGIVEEVALFFKETSLDQESTEFISQDGVKNTVEVFKEELDKVEFNEEGIKQAIDNTKEVADVKGKMLFMPLRIAASKVMHGADLVATIELLGKEKVMANIDSIIETL